MLAALVPLLIVTPLRLLRFPDDDPLTMVVLGPAFEESLKLTATLLVLLLASAVLRGGRDPALALRYWLFLAPWAVGGLFGLLEGLAFYPGQGGADFTLREVAHATFVALALGAALGVWRSLEAPLFGIGFGFGAGFAAHILFNGLGLLATFAGVTFADQVVYLAALVVLSVAVLSREVRADPGSRVARSFLPLPVRRL